MVCYRQINCGHFFLKKQLRFRPSLSLRFHSNLASDSRAWFRLFSLTCDTKIVKYLATLSLDSENTLSNFITTLRLILNNKIANGFLMKKTVQKIADSASYVAVRKDQFWFLKCLKNIRRKRGFYILKIGTWGAIHSKPYSSKTGFHF